MNGGRRNPSLDRISALPDSVLHVILSFLSTKQAVATSLLSKRWKPLWLSLPTFDFDDEAFASFLRFSSFIYSLFLSRDISLPLHSFRLRCARYSFPRDSYDVNRFVYAAVQRRLNHLHLDTSGAYRFNLPPCVLACKTLTVLTLKDLTVNDLPYVDFPNLKTLHLDQVTFRSHEYFEKLLSGCPILEDLRTKGLKGIGRHCSLIELKPFPNLRRADISDICHMQVPFTLLHNAQFLSAQLVPTYYIDFPYFNNLTHMKLILGYTKRRCDWLIEALHHCPKLQNLTIHQILKHLHEICDDEWEHPQVVPECLSSQIRMCCLIDYEGERFELQFAKYIMQNSKGLHTMTIQSTVTIGTDRKLQMLMDLSLCPRVSTKCQLLFK